jgi:hypothetical protein
MKAAIGLAVALVAVEATAARGGRKAVREPSPKARTRQIVKFQC